MPQNQGQLRHLLPLLTQLQQRRLARRRIEHLRNPLQHLAILLADLPILAHNHTPRAVITSHASHATTPSKPSHASHATTSHASHPTSSQRTPIIASIHRAPILLLLLLQSAIMLLLCRRVGSRGRLCLGVLVVRVVLPVRLVGVLMLREDVLHRHLRARMQSPSPRGLRMRGVQSQSR
jgi:hypothetical protein